MTKILLVAVALAGLAAALPSCDNSFLLRGTLNGDCDAPRTILAVPGGSDVATLRKSNCQPTSSVCCRRSSAATRTSCQYPEDCYVAPYMGKCATAVDCADTQECTGGTCQCTLGGPPCENSATHAVTCCASGQICAAGMCSAPLDGGI
jgi:hypothetical protein